MVQLQQNICHQNDCKQKKRKIGAENLYQETGAIKRYENSMSDAPETGTGFRRQFLVRVPLALHCFCRPLFTDQYSVVSTLLGRVPPPPPAKKLCQSTEDIHAQHMIYHVRGLGKFRKNVNMSRANHRQQLQDGFQPTCIRER